MLNSNFSFENNFGVKILSLMIGIKNELTKYEGRE